METKKQLNLKRLGIIGIAILLLLILLGVFFYLSNYNNSNKPVDSNVSGVETSKEPEIGFSVVSVSDIKSYSVKYVEGKNLFELLKDLKAQDKSFSFEYEEASFGVFITTFNGIKADTSNKEFWNIKFNGSDSKVGIKDIIPTPTDNIQFVLNNY